MHHVATVGKHLDGNQIGKILGMRRRDDQVLVAPNNLCWRLELFQFIPENDNLFTVYNEVLGKFAERVADVTRLTGIVRVGSVDFDTATKGDSHRRVTLGLNFRPIEDTVFKFDYQINTEYDPLNVSTPGRAFLFSVATYF